MRTTVTLDDDIVAGLEQVRAERGLGLSAALNELARVGLAVRAEGAAPRFEQRTIALGARVDLSDVAGVLGLLDERADGGAPR